MDTLGKLLLVAGGGYVLYTTGILQSLFGGGTAATSTAAGTPASSTAPVQASPALPAGMPAPVPTWQLALKAAGGGDPQLNFDTWNTYWSTVTGQTGPDPTPYVGAVGTDSRKALLQVAQWWAFMQQWKPGLSGCGMGRLASGPVRAVSAFPRSRYMGVPVNPRDPWAGAFN